MKKILFICEGESTEPIFIEKLKKLFLINDENSFEVYSYCQNIYNLYKELNEDRDLDVIEVLKGHAKKEKDDDGYNILNNAFSEIYLFFDFEFQDQHFSIEKIKEMQTFFDNETEFGNLYINYPMFESIYHFDRLPDINYPKYEVSKKDCKKDKYKILVGSLKFKNKFGMLKMTYSQYSCIAMQNIKKYANLLNKNIDNYDDYKKYFSLQRLLDYQINNFKHNDKIYVINTSILWPIDYFKQNKARKIYNSFISKGNNC